MTRKTATSFYPADYQPRLPLDRLILDQRPEPGGVELDVVFVGAGPAGLAGAIELKKLLDESGIKELQNIEIGILEKSSELGEHCLSGAIVDPSVFKLLFPELRVKDFPFRKPVQKDDVYFLTRNGKIHIPTPPTLRNEGYYIASICEIVRWLGQKAQEQGIHLFTGFPAGSLLVNQAENQVLGVRTVPAGLNPDHTPGKAYLPSIDISARVTVLAEGTRGSLTQAFLKWQGIQSSQPQIYALGVKELWETSTVPQSVIHTLGWPLSRDTFGGSWFYPMDDHLISLGLVVGLDYPEQTLDVHYLLQKLKTHPLFEPYLKRGQKVEWGAKTIPEGGFYSLPSQLYGNGLLIVGDAAGFVNVASLKGIHYAILSGIYAARAAFDALQSRNFSSARLSIYESYLRKSRIYRDLYETRNMRLAFKSGFLTGGLKASLMEMTHGEWPSERVFVPEDAEVPRQIPEDPEPTKALRAVLRSKEDAVYLSGNKTRDDIPTHLILGDGVLGDGVPSQVADFYAHMCPAAVYERENGKLRVRPANCIDCKATDVLGPRWTPREGGSGPRYKRM